MRPRDDEESVLRVMKVKMCGTVLLRLQAHHSSVCVCVREAVSRLSQVMNRWTIMSDRTYQTSCCTVYRSNGNCLLFLQRQPGGYEWSVFDRRDWCQSSAEYTKIDVDYGSDSQDTWCDCMESRLKLDQEQQQCLNSESASFKVCALCFWQVLSSTQPSKDECTSAFPVTRWDGGTFTVFPGRITAGQPCKIWLSRSVFVNTDAHQLKGSSHSPQQNQTNRQPTSFLNLAAFNKQRQTMTGHRGAGFKRLHCDSGPVHPRQRRRPVAAREGGMVINFRLPLLAAYQSSHRTGHGLTFKTLPLQSSPLKLRQHYETNWKK